MSYQQHRHSSHDGTSSHHHHQNHHHPHHQHTYPLLSTQQESYSLQSWPESALDDGSQPPQPHPHHHQTHHQLVDPSGYAQHMDPTASMAAFSFHPHHPHHHNSLQSVSLPLDWTPAPHPHAGFQPPGAPPYHLGLDTSGFPTQMNPTSAPGILGGYPDSAFDPSSADPSQYTHQTSTQSPLSPISPFHAHPFADLSQRSTTSDYASTADDGTGSLLDYDDGTDDTGTSTGPSPRGEHRPSFTSPALPSDLGASAAAMARNGTGSVGGIGGGGIGGGGIGGGGAGMVHPHRSNSAPDLGDGSASTAAGGGFVCYHCPNRYANKGSRARHMRIHGEPKYKCVECDFTARRAKAWRKHLKKVHKRL